MAISEGIFSLSDEEARSLVVLNGGKTEPSAWRLSSTVTPKPIEFIDKPLLQANAFHLFCGRKGMGKGTLLANITARITRGELGKKRQVIWIGTEDSADTDIVPRLMAAGADRERVILTDKFWPQLPRDIDKIADAIVEFGDVGLVIIDPVGNHISGKDSNSETDIRDAISPLNQLADDYKLMVFGVRHFTEKEASKGLLAAVLGSSAWTQLPRAVLGVVRDAEDQTISHVQCIAGNRVPKGTPGRMFRIDGVVLPEIGGEPVTKAIWLGDSAVDVESIFSDGDENTTKSAKARKMILDILDTLGKTPSDQIDAKIAKDVGMSARTVKNVRNKLVDEGLIRHVPEKGDDGSVLFWCAMRTIVPRDDLARNPRPEGEDGANPHGYATNPSTTLEKKNKDSGLLQNPPEPLEPLRGKQGSLEENPDTLPSEPGVGSPPRLDDDIPF